jgi:hypothetical protein
VRSLVPGAALPLAVTVGVGAAVWVGASVHPHPTVHQGALFVHLACLVLGFGSVLTVDWVAAGWALRRRSFDDVMTAAGHAHAPIWAGYAGLVASGALLEPDLHSPLTLVKLAMVLVIGCNGAVATSLQHRLTATSPAGPTGRLMLLSGVVAGVSQMCWWSATMIGFVNAR